MSDTMREISQEYWRPAQPPKMDYNSTSSVDAFCSNCGTQFAPGARFCHVCGGNREPDMQVQRSSRVSDILDFQTIKSRLGLSTTSLILLVIAAGCILATILTGFIYSAATLVEWQAVQTWRIEWMVAAIVALVAAILFKTTPERHD